MALNIQYLFSTSKYIWLDTCNTFYTNTSLLTNMSMPLYPGYTMQSMVRELKLEDFTVSFVTESPGTEGLK